MANPKASPRARVFLPLLFVLAASLAACGGGDGPPAAPSEAVTPITVQLKWTHQTQFAGFYAADQKGYYADEGLEVTLIEGGADIDVRAPVLNGTAQFGIEAANALIVARAEGKPERAISTIYRRSPLVYVARADSGITRPEHLVGQNILDSLSNITSLRAMMARVGIAPDQYTVVTAPFDVELFASGEVPVWAVYLTGSIHILKEAGYELNIIYPHDYGVQFYADSIYATDDYIAANPELVTRFLRATLRGWSYAVENPDDMGPMVLKYDPDADAEVETEKMRASLPLIRTGEDYIGWMKAEMWAGMAEVLREQGVLTVPLDVTEVYTMDFLEEIYGNGQQKTAIGAGLPKESHIELTRLGGTSRD